MREISTVVITNNDVAQ